MARTAIPTSPASPSHRWADGEHGYREKYPNQPADKVYPQAVHLVVRTHPVTARPALFVNRGFTTRIRELSNFESDALLEILFRLVEVPLSQCYFRWQPGSVAFWDNRATQHRAVWDCFPARRSGHHVTIKGDAPFFAPGNAA
jgi:taurine dioxygenase